METSKLKWEIPIIIPSYEPDEKLIGLLKQLKEAGFKNIVVVDDGSGAEYMHFFVLKNPFYSLFAL